MLPTRSTLELLSPAKNLEFGIEAINHGADAVYIGGPAFGARAAAGNAVADIERLAVYAHRFSAHVLVALNTILRDEELEDAERLVWQLFQAGADALIVQDMGLLELDLPPIALHASTQTDNRTPEKVRFLEQVGFSQVVLARELSLAQIRTIANETAATLEFFVHGALCVSFSGQCYISHAYTGRSANRGECSQMCRLPYSLADGGGKVIVRDRRLLSLKDNNQSANLRALAEAGIRSFKIEGRLKDLSYVKNVTAHYRKLLDGIIAESSDYRAASSGRCTFFFEPQPEKTFNRGATDYFVNRRQVDLVSSATPKFVGESVGKVARVGRNFFEIDGGVAIHNGDGLSYFNADNRLEGMRINRADGKRLFPAEMAGGLTIGTSLYRNRDQEFEKLLEKKSAERKIRLNIRFTETAAGFALTLTDENGVSAAADVTHAKEQAKQSDRAFSAIREQLGKFGNTLFIAESVDLELSAPWFIPAGVLNALRREAVERLEIARLAACRRPLRGTAAVPPALYPEAELSFQGNVYNRKARAFYAKHGVSFIESAYECNIEPGAAPLMTTKHCLRYSYNLCPKQVKGLRPDPMTLLNGNEKLTLRFDCARCEMHVVGKLNLKTSF